MTFSHFNRRLHMYLGLSLLPWFFIYGLSSVPFSHPQWGAKVYEDGVPLWKLRFERDYELPMAPEADLKQIGAAMIREAGITDMSYGTYRANPNRINVYAHTFWRSTQISYDIPTKKLRAEDRRFRWDHWLTGMHARGGFQYENPLNDAWAVVVDIVCVGFIVWIASGLYMWWHLPRQRGWGWLALGGGLATFVLFLVRL